MVGLWDIPLSCILGQVLLVHLEMTGVMKVFESAMCVFAIWDGNGAFEGQLQIKHGQK